jgi:hypothetical protein
MNTNKKNHSDQVIKLYKNEGTETDMGLTFISSDEDIYKQKNPRSIKVYQHTYITQKTKDSEAITNRIQVFCSDASEDDLSEDAQDIKLEKIKRNFKINTEIDNIFKEVYSFWLEPKCGGKAATQPYDYIVEDIDFLYIFATSIYKNITECIRKQKEIILNLPSTGTVKEKYYTLKKQIVAGCGSNVPDDLKKRLAQKHSNEIASFCEEYKTDITCIIKALLKAYSGYMSSANMLEHIFGKHVRLLNKVLNEDFTFMDLHTEEFFTAVYTKDDFIKAMIIEVKQRDILMFQELRLDIEKIETEINGCRKVMKKIKEFTEKNSKIFMEEISEFSQGDIKCDVNMLNDFLIQTAK